MLGDMAGDWQHLFSFGAHNNNGGDNLTAPAYYNTRGMAGCVLNTALPKYGLSIESTWTEMNAYILFIFMIKQLIITSITI